MACWPKCSAQPSGVARNLVSRIPASAPSWMSMRAASISPLPAASCRAVSHSCSIGKSTRARVDVPAEFGQQRDGGPGAPAGGPHDQPGSLRASRVGVPGEPQGPVPVAGQRRGDEPVRPSAAGRGTPPCSTSQSSTDQQPQIAATSAGVLPSQAVTRRTSLSSSAPNGVRRSPPCSASSRTRSRVSCVTAHRSCPRIS